MKPQSYDIKNTDDSFTYEFDSRGPKGAIKKMILFKRHEQQDVFELIFGDFDNNTQSVDVNTVTDNGDRNKIIATVIECVRIFFQHQPGAWVVFRGSSISRNRLYRAAISNNIELFSKDFDLFGITNVGMEPFVKTGAYIAFAIARK